MMRFVTLAIGFPVLLQVVLGSWKQDSGAGGALSAGACGTESGSVHVFAPACVSIPTAKTLLKSASAFMLSGGGALLPFGSGIGTLAAEALFAPQDGGVSFLPRQQTSATTYASMLLVVEHLVLWASNRGKVGAKEEERASAETKSERRHETSVAELCRWHARGCNSSNSSNNSNSNRRQTQ